MTDKGSSRGPGCSRRDFLRLASAGAAAGTLLGGTREGKALELFGSTDGLPPERVVPTFCELCFWNCGVHARARGNRVGELRGHPDYPSSNGRLCGRGNAGAAFLRDADRLKYPMVRVGKRGQGLFERVGWKTAYRRIAEGFRKIKEAYGPQGLALFYHGTGGPMLRTMMVAYGTPNFAGPSYAQCKAARNVGYKLTFGEKLPSPEPLDFEKTRCMVLSGSHLGENAHNRQVQDFVTARARGARLIVLDPRLSTVASKADVWLPLQPGTDLAVILSWLHLLIRDDAYDHGFVEKHTTGFDELAAHVRPFTPEWAAEQAGIDAAQIVAAYELIRESMPAVLIHPGRHVAWYGEADTQRARGQAILTALLGEWWAPGGIFRPGHVSLPDYPGPDFPDLPPHVDQAAGRFPFAQEVTTNGIREATRSGAPYPIKGWFVHGSNLLQSMPNVHETVEAIEKLDFLAVCDVQPVEITNYADVVLPESLYLERYDDLLRGTGKRPFIGLRQPVVTSPYDTRPAWRIAKELGTELGVGDFFAFDTFEQYLGTRLQGSGTTLAQLKRDGIFFPTADVKPYLRDGEEVRFHTPSGKVELVSPRLAEAGFDALPSFKPLSPPPKGQLRLLYGRSPLHTFGRTQNNPILSDIAPGNCVWLHPKCAAALGVEHGKPVMVANSHGDETGPMPARVTERMQEKAIYMVHGFGHRRSAGLTRACCMGGSDTDVIDHYAVDPISGGTGMRTQFVTVRPVDPEKEVYPCAAR